MKFFCKKGIPPKEIHEDFMETLGKESPYSTVKKWAGGQREFRMVDSLAAQRCYGYLKISRSCTPWLCVIGETC